MLDWKIDKMTKIYQDNGIWNNNLLIPGLKNALIIKTVREWSSAPRPLRQHDHLKKTSVRHIIVPYWHGYSDHERPQVTERQGACSVGEMRDEIGWPLSDCSTLDRSEQPQEQYEWRRVRWWHAALSNSSIPISRLPSGFNGDLVVPIAKQRRYTERLKLQIDSYKGSVKT